MRTTRMFALVFLALLCLPPPPVRIRSAISCGSPSSTPTATAAPMTPRSPTTAAPASTWSRGPPTGPSAPARTRCGSSASPAPARRWAATGGSRPSGRRARRRASRSAAGRRRRPRQRPQPRGLGSRPGEHGFGSSEFRIYGQLLGADGAEIGVDDFAISGSQQGALYPHVAFKPGTAAQGDEEYLVVWTANTTTNPVQWGKRLDENGAAIGSSFQISQITESGGDAPPGRLQPGHRRVPRAWYSFKSGEDGEAWGQRINASTGAAIGGDVPLTAHGTHHGRQRRRVPLDRLQPARRQLPDDLHAGRRQPEPGRARGLFAGAQRDGGAARDADPALDGGQARL